MDEELRKQLNIQSQLLGRVIATLNAQNKQHTPAEQLIALLGGEKAQEKEQTAVERLNTLLSEQQQQPQDTGLLSTVLTPIAAQLDNITKKLDATEQTNQREKVVAAFKEAAQKAGITDAGKQDDVVKLYSQNFDLVDDNLVMTKDGKTVDDPEQPGVKIGFDHFNKELKERRPDYYNSDNISTDIFSHFGLDSNGSPTIDTNGKVEINVTDPNWTPTEEQQKALDSNNAVFVMD